MIEWDHRVMKGMTFGETLDFGWVTDQPCVADAAVNGT